MSKQTTTKKLKPITISKARTAWGLLKDVRKHMAEEPKRVDMWHVQYQLHPANGGPPCGTVGCFAGNITFKAGIEPSIYDVYDSLGQGIDYSFQGFFGLDYGVFNAGTGDECQNTDPRTAEHLAAVLKRVDDFMRRNERNLKARRIPVTAMGRRALVAKEQA